MKLDITTIILTYNEEIHIRRALENATSFSSKVYVVDSPSTDATVAICREFDGVEVVVHPYPGTQAEQFNWALDNLPVTTEWILRLDADEYLLPELIDELTAKLPAMSSDVSALSLPLARAFMGRRLRHGIVGSVRLVRIFRKGRARSEQRLMDEHLVVTGGTVVEMDHHFIDDNRLPIGRFIVKHDNYASREAAMLLLREDNPGDDSTHGETLSDAARSKRRQKDGYARLPLFWRALAYFLYRYIFKLGFLDGKEGFCWDFFQGLWYRMLVDAKVMEVRRACGDDREKMRRYLSDHYGITV